MARGFTLLEMLVVLVILGLAAAVVAPPLARTLERVREAGDRDDVARGLEALPARAREAGRALVFRAGEPIVIRDRPWPEGWAVVPVAALRVEANGFCQGGTLQVARPSGRTTWALGAPDCRLETADAP
ncbi:MAG: type II secretion system protein [Silanimonas sp.]